MSALAQPTTPQLSSRALAMIAAGANRIGASASVKIVQEAEQAESA